MTRAVSVSIDLGETERGCFGTDDGARELSDGEEEGPPEAVQSDRTISARHKLYILMAIPLIDKSSECGP